MRGDSERTMAILAMVVNDNAVNGIGAAMAAMVARVSMVMAVESMAIAMLRVAVVVVSATGKSVPRRFQRRTNSVHNEATKDIRREKGDCGPNGFCKAFPRFQSPFSFFFLPLCFFFLPVYLFWFFFSASVSYYSLPFLFILS